MNNALSFQRIKYTMLYIGKMFRVWELVAVLGVLSVIFYLNNGSDGYARIAFLLLFVVVGRLLKSRMDYKAYMLLPATAIEKFIALSGALVWIPFVGACVLRGVVECIHHVVDAQSFNYSYSNGVVALFYGVVFFAFRVPSHSVKLFISNVVMAIVMLCLVFHFDMRIANSFFSDIQDYESSRSIVLTVLSIVYPAVLYRGFQKMESVMV